MYKVLTIAGSDCSGGAGIQADLKTITAHKMYGMSVVTALTAQNTTGVYGVFDCAPDFVGKQLDCVMEDIFPDAVKIGMVSSAQIIEVIAQKLTEYGVKHIVADPVMVSTSGSKLLSDGAAEALITRLLPLAEVITPNIPEAEALTGMTIHSRADMECAAQKIAAFTKGAVLVKGGHLADTSADLLWQNGTAVWFEAERIATDNTHGTGCTLSSAIACSLAAGLPLAESVRRAKTYVTDALKAGLNLGKGNGPLDHCCRISTEK